MTSPSFLATCCRAQDVAEFLDPWLAAPRLPSGLQATFAHYYGSWIRGFPPRTRAYYRDQLREVEALVRGASAPRVLEVGSGCGSESLWLARLGARVTGIDVRADRVAVANARLDLLREVCEAPLECSFAVRSLFDLEPEERFDLLWLEQSFHHLEPRDAVVARLAGLLAPGGHIVLSEGNAWNLPLQAQFFLQRGWRTRGTYTDETGRTLPYGVERITTAGAVSRAFARHGVTTVATRHFRALPNTRLLDPLAPLEKLLGRLRLVPLLTTYNWVGRRATTPAVP
jgi:SAM-dependent methyltransferase